MEKLVEFMKCKECGGNKWFIQEALKKAKADGKIPEDRSMALNVYSTHMRDGTQKVQVGEVWDILNVVEDVCMGCGHRQVIWLERSEGRGVMRSGLVIPNMEPGQNPMKN